MQLLYLDFDGVLHPEDVRIHRRRGIYVHSPAGHELFENAELLADLLDPHPSISIVLSTSWVRSRGFHRARKWLPIRLRDRVIGATFHRRYMSDDEFKILPRGLQVWADTMRRRPKRWLAIDDDENGWPTWCRDRLVKTHEIAGIAEPTVLEQLEKKLAQLAEVGIRARGDADQSR